MGFIHKEDTYDDYKMYSRHSLKTQHVQEDSELQGYIPSQSEKQNKAVPVETMRMKNTEGELSVGVDKNRDVTIAIRSDSSSPFLRGDRNAVDMDSAKRVRNITGRLYTNSHDDKVSAVVYKERLEKSPTELLKKLKKAFGHSDNPVIDEMTPFLSIQEDNKTKGELGSLLRNSLETRNKEQYETILAERELLQKRIDRKEKEEQRLLQNLTTTSNLMNQQARQLGAEKNKTAYFISEFLNSDALADETGPDGQDNEDVKGQEGQSSGKAAGYNAAADEKSSGSESDGQGSEDRTGSSGQNNDNREN